MAGVNPKVMQAEDLKAKDDFLHAVRHDLVTLNGAVRRIKDVKLQVSGLEKRADELYNPNLKTSQDSLNFLPKLDFQIAGVGGMSDTADAKPTAAARRGTRICRDS